MSSTVLDDLRGDVPYALRGLMRSPGFTVAAVITLGLGIGIGAATAVFSVVNSSQNRRVPGAQRARHAAAIVLRDTPVALHSGASPAPPRSSPSCPRIEAFSSQLETR